jgi:hypothetical protein
MEGAGWTGAELGPKQYRPFLWNDSSREDPRGGGRENPTVSGAEGSSSSTPTPGSTKPSYLRERLEKLRQCHAQDAA